MFCMKCGQSLPDDALFCSSCGTKTIILEDKPEQGENLEKDSADGQTKNTLLSDKGDVIGENVLIEKEVDEENILKEKNEQQTHSFGFIKKYPKLKITLFIFLVIFLLNIIIKFAIGVYFPWDREDWSFLPYTYWNEDTELKGGKILSYDGVEKVVVIPRNIKSPYAKSGMDGTKVVAIESWAFGYLSPRQAETIEVIIVPEGIEKIEKRAFCGCENLKLLYLPMSIKEISPGAFSGISSASVITFNPVVLDALNEARN